MRVLVLNSGSSSLKFQLIETGREQTENDTDKVLARGTVERIGTAESKIELESGKGDKQGRSEKIGSADDAIRIALEFVQSLPGGERIDAVGHRFVHGGDLFRESVLINEDVLAKIESLSALAPLHNPHNLAGYYASRKLLPDAKQTAVFDTAFHHTLPPQAHLYGIPHELAEREKIRKYGFHGTSFRYILARYSKLLQKPESALKLIICHLGNGCSMCAIDRGKSVDTTMGFTPMDGLLMGTRCGEIDPGAVIYLARKDPRGIDGAEQILNQSSGLSGVTGGANDMRDILERRDGGDRRAADAIDLFCYRIVKTIGAYLLVLRGADAIVFTGGIGEHAGPVRQQIGESLKWLNIEIDGERNRSKEPAERAISGKHSAVPVWVVPTDEELWIARDTFRCAGGV